MEINFLNTIIHKRKPMNQKQYKQLKKVLESNNPEPKNKYLKVGQMIECGNCHPEKFEDCKKLEAEYPNIKCDCICHQPEPKNDYTNERKMERFYRPPGLWQDI